MPPDSLTDLAQRLDVRPAQLSALETCSPDELARLDAAVAAAMTHEDELVEKGLTEAVRFVPRPLRRTATKLLFGGNVDE